MKKIFFALAAVAALASCSKVEAEYEQTGEIALAPVPKNITKSMIAGDGKGSNMAFPTSEEFNVWAWYKPLDAGTNIEKWMKDDAEQQLYIRESTFKKKTGSESWGGKSSPYFWPKLGSLLFAGYYPTDIATNVDYNFDATTNEMVFSNIPQSEVSADEASYKEDIMYFNMTASSSDKGPVAVVFKHALSWITVNVKLQQMNPAPAKVVINEIKFTKVNNKGTGTVAGTNSITWKTTGTDEETILGNNVILTTTAKKLVEPLFIPQKMLGDLVIKYTFYSNANEYVTETYTKALSDLKDGINTWDPAKHYVYNIEIGFDEILIDPQVTDWTEVEIPVVVKK